MNGKTPANHSFKKKDQAITLAVKSSVKVQDDNLQVDPDLLFQSLASFAAELPVSLENAFVYELCSYPPALFDSSLFLRESQKSQFGDAIWSMIQHPEISLPTDVQYVIDGGSLLHKVPWVRGETFRGITLKYVNFVLTKLGKSIIVFDGYHFSSTKDMTHRRRTKGKTGIQVTFTIDMQLSISKDVFLLNKTNKQIFIEI